MSRAEDLFNHVYRPNRPSWLDDYGFKELPTRIRCILASNKVKTDLELFKAVKTRDVLKWRNCGDKTIRDICEYLAVKFPKDPETSP